MGQRVRFYDLITRPCFPRGNKKTPISRRFLGNTHFLAIFLLYCATRCHRSVFRRQIGFFSSSRYSEVWGLKRGIVGIRRSCKVLVFPGGQARLFVKCYRLTLLPYTEIQSVNRATYAQPLFLLFLNLRRRAFRVMKPLLIEGILVHFFLVAHLQAPATLMPHSSLSSWGFDLDFRPFRFSRRDF